MVHKNLNDDNLRAWILTLIEEFEKIRESKSELHQLRRPNFEVNDHLTRTLGSWHEEKRLITFAEVLFQNGNWGDVIAVLKHEMAHQIVSEIFGIRNSEPHGEAFKRACMVLNIPFGACYKPSMINTPTSSNLVNKIHKLLALGQSANKFEAENALSKAHELSLKHNIKLQKENNVSDFGLRLLGPLSKRMPSYLWAIMNILEVFYFIKYIRRPLKAGDNEGSKSSGNILEIYGTKENLEMAEYVYYFLLNHGKLEWERYKDKRGLKNNSFKKSFLNGMYQGFCSKLEKQDRTLAKEKSLVWLGDAKLDAFFRQRNPHVRKVKNQLRIEPEAHNAGVKRGEKLRIHPGLMDDCRKKSLVPQLLSRN